MDINDMSSSNTNPNDSRIIGLQKRHTTTHDFRSMSNFGGSNGDTTYIPIGGHSEPPLLPTRRGGGRSRSNQQQQQQNKPMAWFSDKVNFNTILLVLMTIFMATMTIIIMVLGGWFLTNRAVIMETAGGLEKRFEPIEETVRSINNMMRVVRRVYGDELFDRNIANNKDLPDGIATTTTSNLLDSGSIKIAEKQQSTLPPECRASLTGANGAKRRSIPTKCAGFFKPKHGLDPHKFGFRSGEEESYITEEMARTVIRIFKSVQGIIAQADKEHTIKTATNMMHHADCMMTSPQMESLFDVVALAANHPDTKVFASQTVAIVSHFEAIILPIMDVLAEEIKLEIEGLLEDAEQATAHDKFQAYMLEIGDVFHKVSTGMRDVVVWYRGGGPADALSLANDLIRISKELVESPAALSLVKVLDSINWKTMGHEFHQTATDLKFILSGIRKANSVDAVDKLLRSLGRVLEDPATTKAIAMLPSVVADASAMIRKNSTQRLITQGTVLFEHLGLVLTQAEKSHAVERSTEFMGALKALIDGLGKGGLHLGLGEDLDQEYRGRDRIRKPSGNLLDMTPHIETEADRQRKQRRRPNKQQQQRT